MKQKNNVLAKLIFNNSMVDAGWKKNTENGKTVGIYWTGVADGGAAFYNIENKQVSDNEIEKSILSCLRGSYLYTVRNAHPLFNVGDVYKPFDLLVKLRFKGDAKAAESYLIEHSYDDPSKYIKELLFTDKDKFDAYKASEFLKADGYIRVSEQGRDETLVYKVDSGVMTEFNIKSDTIALFKSMLSGNALESDLANELNKSRAVVKSVWDMLDPVAYDLQMDTKTEVFIPFANGVAKISDGNESFELVPYEGLKLFLKTDSMKHSINPLNVRNRIVGNFEEFFRYAVVGHNRETLTAKEADDLKAFYSAIGYLLSGHKNMALNKAIIFSDAGADDIGRNGRRGKTLIMLALRMFKPTLIKGGSEFDPSYRHVFAEIEKYHRLYLIDDVPKNFNFHALYTNITGGISAERKGTKAVEIPYSHSPKFVISTNWLVPRKEGESSTIARFAEYKFSSFFNSENTPLNYFNQTFFEDWDDKEYQSFYEFMIICVMTFLSGGLQEIEYNKDEDNFLAYFSNSAIEEEMSRIMDALKQLKQFRVTDFMEEHARAEIYKYKPLFSPMNARDKINIWINYHELNWKYDKQWKRWENKIHTDIINPF